MANVGAHARCARKGAAMHVRMRHVARGSLCDRRVRHPVTRLQLAVLLAAALMCAGIQRVDGVDAAAAGPARHDAGHCDKYDECGSCTRDAACGWCSSDFTCLPGTNASRPSQGVCASPAWHYEGHHCSSCFQQHTCATCTHLHACGWCSDTNQCYVGGASPPAYSHCKADDWSWVGCEDIDNDDEWRLSGPLFIGVVIVLPVLLCVAVIAALVCVRRQKAPDWTVPDDYEDLAPHVASGLSRFRPASSVGSGSVGSGSGRGFGRGEDKWLQTPPLGRGSSGSGGSLRHGSRPRGSSGAPRSSELRSSAAGHEAGARQPLLSSSAATGYSDRAARPSAAPAAATTVRVRDPSSPLSPDLNTARSLRQERSGGSSTSRSSFSVSGPSTPSSGGQAGEPRGV